eukprot:295834-Chlamydomonas_euryale.AAC.1
MPLCGYARGHTVRLRVLPYRETECGHTTRLRAWPHRSATRMATLCGYARGHNCDCCWLMSCQNATAVCYVVLVVVDERKGRGELRMQMASSKSVAGDSLQVVGNFCLYGSLYGKWPFSMESPY